MIDMGQGVDLLLQRTRQVFDEQMQSVIDAMRSNPMDKDWQPTPVSDDFLLEMLQAANNGEPRSMCPAYRAANMVIMDRVRAGTGMPSRFAW